MNRVFVFMEGEMKTKIAPFAIILLCTTLAYTHTQEKKMSLSADGIEVLEIDCGEGTLDVRGSTEAGRIEVTAEIVLKGASEEKANDYIRKHVELSLEKKGDKAILVSRFQSRRLSFLSFGGKAINLTVTIPEDMDIGVDDGSGDILIESIAGSVRIDDGSGAIRIQGIRGNLEVDDGSGVIKVAEITGDVEIDDGSGSIYARAIGGNVTLWDGSGSIEVDGVSGDVYLKDDGSGSVDITNVEGRIIK
jgi:DUF4097 and DUF4098 domain-containing protein YvlB